MPGALRRLLAAAALLALLRGAGARRTSTELGEDAQGELAPKPEKGSGDKEADDKGGSHHHPKVEKHDEKEEHHHKKEKKEESSDPEAWAKQAKKLDRRKAKKIKMLPAFVRPSHAEFQKLERMMVPTDRDSLGKGRDVQIREHGKRRAYNNLKLVSAWKVAPDSKKLLEYLARRDEWNAAAHGEKKDSVFMNTAMDDVVLEDRKSGVLGENEYWMFHGGASHWMMNEVIQGATFPGKGVFGNGVYLADAPDKMDQYVSVDEHAEVLKELIQQDDELVDAALAEGRQLYVGYVMRAYMHRHAQVQVGKRDNTWYWRDPVTEQTVVDHPKNKGKLNSNKPPWEDIEFDSVQVMCTRVGHGKRGYGLHFGDPKEFKYTGNFPDRFNEYLAYSNKQLAIDYLVVYSREYDHKFE